MSDSGHSTTSPALDGRGRATTAALCVAMAAVVPFAATGLFRLGLHPPVVLLLCLAAAGGLAAVPRRGPWLAVGWLVGCALWAVALVGIFWQFGQGMEGFE